MAAATASDVAATAASPPPPSYDYDQLPSYLHPQMPTLAPLPPNYPPPPQFQPYFPAGPPCKCDVANQIRYYNYRTRQRARGGGRTEGRRERGAQGRKSRLGERALISVPRVVCAIDHSRDWFCCCRKRSRLNLTNESILSQTEMNSMDPV